MRLVSVLALFTCSCPYGHLSPLQAFLLKLLNNKSFFRKWDYPLPGWGLLSIDFNIYSYCFINLLFTIIMPTLMFIIHIKIYRKIHKSVYQVNKYHVQSLFKIYLNYEYLTISCILPETAV